MRKFAFLWGIVVGVLLALAPAQAEVVGRFTQVEGRVDLLKGGNLPATPVKVDAAVEPKDVVRTKSLSKAQITFIDNSVITISPESRIAIEDYTVDTAKGKRHAVLEIFQGLALAVVNKIFKAEEPDFVVKTQTAIMGVRGTEFGIRIQPNSSTIMNFKGLLQVGNVFPEVSQRFLKAFKVAFSFGSLNNVSDRWVLLHDMQGTTVARNLPPTLPYTITIQDRELFMLQLNATVPRASTFSGETEVREIPKPPGVLSSTTPVSFSNYGEQVTLAYLNTVTVPPVLLPSPTKTFTFSQSFDGTYTKPSVSPYAVATYQGTGGSGTRIGVYPSAFTANFAIVATASPGSFSSSSSGTFSATSLATVTGPTGGVLTGTMQMSAATNGGTTFTLSGPVTLNPNGMLSFQTNGTFKVGSISGTTTGTWTQTNKSSAR